MSLIAFVFSFSLSGYIVQAQSGSLRINEFLAVNQSGLKDEDGEYSDWIEIYNTSSEAVELHGWALTDDKSVPFKWIFPDVTLGKNSYLVVFASDKDRRIQGQQLHTSFKLSGDGEYLALINPVGSAVTEFDPFYPVQQADMSFGYLETGYIIMSQPTPGAENIASSGILLAPPVFDKDHGFYDAPFTLGITSPDQDAVIYYTTDGSMPGINNGTLYAGPLNIATTAIIRAVCIRNNQILSRITTRTYLFPDDVIHQPNNPEGYPSTWSNFISISGTAPGDYEMDPEMMADAEFANSVKEALLDLPVISLVTDKGYFFSKEVNVETGGIYIYTGTAGGTGYGWERPVTFEYFDAKDSVSFQVDCGVQIHGGEGRRPEKSPKHSFRLLFKSEYGPARLNFPLFGDDAVSSFNTIILRAGFGNTWIHWSHSERKMAQYLRDRWTKDTQRAMGHHSSHGIYVHLYINGLYWGVYNPSERMDSDFAESYLGGDEADYDVIKDYSEAVDGNNYAWKTLISLANSGLKGNAAYQTIRGNNPDGTPNPQAEAMVDVVNLADYMLLNFYGGNWDWDHHNWVAIRNRVDPGKGFKFFSWDAEHMVEGVTANVLSENNDNCPSRVFQQLRQNEDFLRLFADRVQKFCFNNGALTPSSAAEGWTLRAGQIDKAVLAESARWGDYRRDAHPYQTAGPFELYTKKDHWLPQMNYMLNTYFPGRTNVFISQLRTANLFPSIDAPALLINNNPIIRKTIKKGDVLTMTSAKGNIWYTTDGSDPAVFSPSVTFSPSAKMYVSPITVSESSHIKARTIYNGEWSATNEQFFIIPEDFHDIKFTEIHYHPSDEGDIDNGEFEFIEIKNTGTSTLNLEGMQFVKGVEYRFFEETPFRPNEFIVLASNRDHFYDRYGFLPFDIYGGKLDNNGERLTLITSESDTICSFAYSDFNGWPELPDGGGNSLVPTDFNPANEQDLPEYWRASYTIGGSPGADDILIPYGEKSSEILTVYQNYPNPFSNSTTISYKLHEDAYVNLSVFNMVGKQVVTLEDINKISGLYIVEWNGDNQNGSFVENGVYYLRITARSKSGVSIMTKKMLLIRKK